MTLFHLVIMNESVCTLTMTYGLISCSYLYWPACPHCPTSFLLCGWLREDRLSSSKLHADSMNTETSLLYQTCKVAFMTVQIHDDGRDPGAQAVHLLTRKHRHADSDPLRRRRTRRVYDARCCSRLFPSECLNHSTPAFRAADSERVLA